MNILPNKTFPSFMDTSSTDLISEFFIPALTASIRYDRGVGFFSAGWLKIAAKGMAEFAQNSGRARWVISPILSEDDWNALQLGEAARHDEFLRRVLEKNLDDLEQKLEKETLSALAWLIADGILDFKLALPKNKLEHGEFHDKFGIFTDSEGNQVSFNGSYNDSIQGTHNYESIKIFCSWQPAFTDLVRADAERFEQLWNNFDLNVQVFDLPEAARARIVRFRTQSRPYPELMTYLEEKSTISLSGVFPHSYQTEAIKEWEKNGRRGIIDMATGTGKTMVALTAITHCDNVGFIIIGAPTNALVTQWMKELNKLEGIHPPIEISANNPKWPEELLPRLKLAATDETRGSPFVFVGTYKSLAGNRFHSILDKIPPIDTLGLIIADEVHNLGAPTYQRLLRPHFSHRLGLTATLERAYDEEGTQVIEDYFEGVVYKLGIDKAVGSILCRYHYHVHFAELNEDEFGEYQRLSVQIASLIVKSTSQNSPEALPSKSAQLSTLLNRRARIIKLAKAKLELLAELLTQIPISKCLIYCADLEQLHAVQKILANAGISQLPYTSAEKPFAKRTALDQLRRNNIQAVVAIKCLDEGIDVPQVHQAILLASSTSEREFVQRRGRILRRAEGKRFAKLIDIFTIPPRRYHENPPPLLFNELERAKILARAADNRFEAEIKLFQELSDFGICIEQTSGV